MTNAWKERARPARLENRYEFQNYDALRDFLDEAADLSEQEGLYPDLGFARDYVNVTIHPDEGSTEIGEKQRRFAQLLDELC